MTDECPRCGRQADLVVTDREPATSTILAPDTLEAVEVCPPAGMEDVDAVYIHLLTPGVNDD